jgi:hypothetical protein
MLRGLSILISPILILLLIMLTPVGTGQGAHRDQLLDPLFPHIHFAGGLTAPQSAAVKLAQRIFNNGDQQGPAFGAGAGAASAALSPGLTPPVPARIALAPMGAEAWAVLPLDARPSGASAEPPPDPPPTAS